MAIHTSPLSIAPVNVIKAPQPDERRREPRFGAEGEVTVVLLEAGNEHEYKAKLLDFSLHGLRLQMPAEIREGVEVHVFFSWGEISTQVMWSSPLPTGCEIGLQLF
jgi:PilZ domain